MPGVRFYVESFLCINTSIDIILWSLINGAKTRGKASDGEENGEPIQGGSRAFAATFRWSRRGKEDILEATRSGRGDPESRTNRPPRSGKDRPHGQRP